jgi:hypothetical protein
MMLALATKLDVLAKRLRNIGGELLAISRDLEVAARILRGDPP